MMSGPLPASTAAAVFGCSWSPLTVWIVTVTPLADENSAAWRLISSSAAGTKLVHCRSWTLAPALGLGIAAVLPEVLGLVDPPPQASSRAGPTARLPAARPACLRICRRSQTGDQPDGCSFSSLAMLGPPLSIRRPTRRTV